MWYVPLHIVVSLYMLVSASGFLHPEHFQSQPDVAGVIIPGISRTARYVDVLGVGTHNVFLKQVIVCVIEYVCTVCVGP